MQVSLASEFAAEWASSKIPPDVFGYLQNRAATASEKLSVLLVDQKHRWKTNQPHKVEDYLARFTDLSSDPEIKLQLALGEFQARKNGDTTPLIEEFTSRFSDLGESLTSKLKELASNSSPNIEDKYATQSFDPAQPELRIGRYRLIRLLGEGAFGIVWLAFEVHPIKAYLAL